MQKVRVPINSFQYGEVSDSLIMRTDTPIYAQSAQRLENLVVMGEGSVKKRYGLKHIYDYSITYNSTYPDQSHLFKFIFDDNEQYIISVEHQKVRCFQLETNGTITLVSTITQDVDGNTLPFNQSYLQQYTYAQYGDVMFISHPLFAPRTLLRTGLTSFEIDTFTFDVRADDQVTYQPYTKYQANDVTLDPSGTTGSVTLTTSADYWDTTGTQTGGDYLNSLHVGVTVRYGEAEIDITSVQSATQATGTVVDEIKRRLTVLNPLRTTDQSDIVEVTMINHGFAGNEAITIEDAAPTGGINTSNINGSRTVYEIIDENTFSYQAGGTANQTEDGGGYVTIVSHAPTLDWDEQSWSAKRGYPAAVTFHENRLCFGGTLAEPDAIWMSKIGEYFNFDVGEAADTDSINLIAATGDVNEIRYMVSNRDLQVFTASGELYVPTYLNQAITPTNAQIRKQTPYGTEYVQPVSIDGATIFAQKDGKVIREYIYTDGEDAYTASAVSTLASHLIDEPHYLTVSHSAFGLPDSYAALTLGNGDMALFSSNRAERRASWTRVTTDGNFESVVAVHDRLFANIWYDNELHLCEFDTEVGLDQWSSVNYLANSGLLPTSGVTAEFTAGSTTVKIRIESTGFDIASFLLAGNKVGDYVHCEDFTDYGLIGDQGLDLSDLNNNTFEITEINSTSAFVQFETTISSAANNTTTITDASNQGSIFVRRVVAGPFSNGNTYDAIFTENSVVKHETITAEEGRVYIGGLGTSGPDNATNVYVGRKFTSKLVSNPIDASMGNGPATGEPRGITNVVVDVKSTESMKVNSRPSISSSFTGKKEVKLLGYSRNPQVTIEQDDPLPMQINGIVAELIV